MTPQEQLQLAEETAVAMGGRLVRRKPVSGTTVIRMPDDSTWYLYSDNPLSNDLAALCKKCLVDAGRLITITYFPKEALWRVDTWRNGEVLDPDWEQHWSRTEAATENEALCRAVLAVKEKGS